MIKLLNNKNYKIASEIVKLQKQSYQIEADIIGYQYIPPLLETPNRVMINSEIFYGYYIENVLIGLISYKVKNRILDIYRVAVLPKYFRNGIAENMIRYLENNNTNINKIIVSTGQKNKPAVNLYLKLGFSKTSIIDVDGVPIINFERDINR